VVPFGLNISNTAFGHALEAMLNIDIPVSGNPMENLHI